MLHINIGHVRVPIRSTTRAWCVLTTPAQLCANWEFCSPLPPLLSIWPGVHVSLQFTIERQPTNAVEQFLYACARQFAVVLTSNAMYHLLKSTQRVDMDDIEKLHRYIDNEWVGQGRVLLVCGSELVVALSSPLCRGWAYFLICALHPYLSASPQP